MHPPSNGRSGNVVSGAAAPRKQASGIRPGLITQLERVSCWDRHSMSGLVSEALPPLLRQYPEAQISTPDEVLQLPAAPLVPEA